MCEIVCRICMIQQENMIDIFQYNMGNDAANAFLMRFCNVMIVQGDGLPSKICVKCLRCLKTTYKFKKQCEQTDFILRQKVQEQHALKQEKADINLGMHKQPESNENENKSIYQNSCDNFYPTYTQTNPEQTPIQQNEESIKVIANIIKEPNLKKTKARKNATCPVCYQKFVCYEDYQVHVQKHNGDIEKPYKCKACGKSYLCASLLNRHLFTHTNTKLYECSVCKKDLIILLT
ncbi:zinc finger protein 267-like [Ctenocephalides felis]|uniref:zinc finger protein 267-like n=1 Tax=Ctenocephalides felis TaxID=7515 RepID=UPI000E6E3179|nr:zinc finger protein 267-like [Ctenocephalides felis]